VKPIFTCTADGKNITSNLEDRLISLRITDESGMRSDRVEITLDNRGGNLAHPRKGLVLSTRVGYEGQSTYLTGEYTVDEFELSEGTMTIHAMATSMREKLKAPRSFSWHGLNIGQIVEAIAERNKYEARVSPPLDSILLSHIDQTEESDMHFLTRLALDHGAIFKPANGYLLFRAKDDPKTFSGKTRTPVKLTKQDIMSGWRYSSKDRSNYQAVKARWRDTSQNKDIFVTVGEGEKVYSLRHSYPDGQQAQAAAEAKMAALDRGEASFSFATPGHPGAGAETELIVSEFGPVIDSALWVMKRVEHRMDSSGFTTYISAGIAKGT